MKRCPKCGQIFVEDSDFCLDDGTPLYVEGVSEPTAVLHAPPLFSSHAATVVRTPKPPYLIFGLVLMFSVLSAGFGVAYFMGGGEKVETVKESPQPSPTEVTKADANENRPARPPPYAPPPVEPGVE